MLKITCEKMKTSKYLHSFESQLSTTVNTNNMGTVTYYQGKYASQNGLEDRLFAAARPAITLPALCHRPEVLLPMGASWAF